MKKIKANTMILVMFIMLVSSLLWLLVTQYVRDMITISWLFTQYYTTYFHAYWWLEMWLSLINYRLTNEIDQQNPFGYEDNIVFTWYTNCWWVACWFAMDIRSRWSVITDSSRDFDTCIQAVAADSSTNRTLYTIWWWDGFIIPLFFDRSTWFSVVDYEVILWNDWEPSEFEALDPQIYSRYESEWTDEQYIVRIIDEQVLNYNLSIEPDVSNWTVPQPLAITWLVPFESAQWSGTPLSGQNKNYLVIANATGSVKQFCLQLDGMWPGWTPPELPQKFMRIESIAEYVNTTVAFRAIKTNELPSFLIYWTINP